MGLVVLLPLAFTWGRPKGRAPWYQYTGGLIGILSVVFVNIGVSGIGVTANLVLMLLGQVTCSAVVDHFGLLGAAVHRMNPGKLLSMGVMALGYGAMLALRAAGRRLPEDVSIAGFGNSWINEFSQPRLTTARLFQEECGRDAAGVLLQMLEQDAPGSPVRKVALGYSIVERDSV